MLTTSGLRLGIGLPQVFPRERVDAGLVRRFAQRAEELGYEDLWLTDAPIDEHGVLEPLTLLTYVAGVTERIRLGVSVLILNHRNPVQLAKSVATLDQLSGGRVTLGVGMGGGTARFPLYGLGPERPVARFLEALRVMRALWEQEGVTLKGDFWQLENVTLEPKPLQPRLPIWFGGHVPAALRRSVRLGDAWMGAGSSRIEDFFADIALVRQYRAAAGRNETTFPLSKRVYIAVDDDEATAHERLRAGLVRQYGVARPGAGVSGTPSQCVTILRRLRDAGLQHLLLHPVTGTMDQLEMLTSRVAPEL